MNRNSHKYGFSLCYTGCPKKVGFTFTANKNKWPQIKKWKKTDPSFNFTY